MSSSNVYNKEPVVNWKCILLTGVLASGYWFLPKRNKWILAALLYFPYLALAWYDHIYACARNMGPTYLSLFYWWAKPRDSVQIQQYVQWNPAIKRKVWIVDLILLGIGALFVPYFLKWNP